MTDLDSTLLPRRVSLSIFGWLSHYYLSIYLASIAIICLYILVVGGHGPKRHDLNLLLIALPALVVAYAFAWMRARSLIFTILKTSDGAAENYRKILEVMVGQDWYIRDHVEGEMITAQVKAPWRDLTWGELVTVRMSGSYIALNCVGDPYGSPAGSRTDDARATAAKDLVLGALRII